MNAQKIQNNTRNQKKLIDRRVTFCFHVCQLQLLHSLLCLSSRSRAEAYVPVAISIHFQNHIIICLILSAILIASQRHHHFVKAQDIPLPKINICMSLMDFIQCISVTGNLCFVVVQRSAVLIDNRGDTLVAGYNAFNRIGTFDGLNSGYSFQFCEYL